MLHSKDNEAARRRRRGVLYTYVEEADDEANKVSQRMRLGITELFSRFNIFDDFFSNCFNDGLKFRLVLVQ